MFLFPHADDSCGTLSVMSIRLILVNVVSQEHLDGHFKNGSQTVARTICVNGSGTRCGNVFNFGTDVDCGLNQ